MPIRLAVGGLLLPEGRLVILHDYGNTCSMDLTGLLSIESAEVLWDYCLERSIAAPSDHVVLFRYALPLSAYSSTETERGEAYDISSSGDDYGWISNESQMFAADYSLRVSESGLRGYHTSRVNWHQL